MDRRDISRVLLATAAGSALLSRRAEAQTCSAPCYAQSSAEISANVTPVNTEFPPLNVLRYGTNSTPGTTVMTTAFQHALQVAAIQGGTVIVPEGRYRIDAGLVVPANVILQGSGGAGIGGGLGTVLEHYVTGGTAVTLGTSDASLDYGCGLRDLTIQMHLSNTVGVLLRCTVGAQVRNIQIKGDGAVFTYTGVVIRGGSSATASNFLNVLDNVYCLFIHKGFVFTDLGTIATMSTFVGCSAFGSKLYGDTTSIGVEFNGGSGLNAVFLGGNFEECGTGVKFSNVTQGTSFFGVRFENNTADIDWGTNTTVGRNTIFGYGNIGSMAGTRFDNGSYIGQYVNDVRISRGKSDVPGNIAIGDSVLQKVTGGSGRNVGLGNDALKELLTAVNSTALGDSALKVTTANNNTAVGYAALFSDTSGAQNTAIGTSAASSITTGGNNCALGYNAQTGSSGNNNLALGFNSGTASSPHNIGANESGQVVIGDSNITNAYIQVPWTVISDERDKRDIAALDAGLEVVNALKPIRYRLDDRNRYSGDRDGSRANACESVGFSAQNVKAALESAGLPPELVVDVSNPDKMGLTDTRLIPFLVIAIQNLSLKLARANA